MEREFRVIHKESDAVLMEGAHTHRELELTMVLSDRVRCTINEKNYVLPKNTLVLFNNFERHYITAPDGGGYERYICMFLPSFVGVEAQEDLMACFFDHPTAEANLLPLEPEEAARVYEMLQRMEALYRQPQELYARRLELQLLLKVLLVEVNRMHRARWQAGQSTDGVYNRISRVVEYIQGHLDHQLSLGEIARQFAVSRTQLAAEFKVVTGTSTWQYIISCRIWRAAALLEVGATVEEAGAAVGFGTLAHFSRSFKAHVGQGPKQYALSHRTLPKSAEPSVPDPHLWQGPTY